MSAAVIFLAVVGFACMAMFVFCVACSVIGIVNELLNALGLRD